MSDTPRKRAIGRHACQRCRRAKIRCLTHTLEIHGKCQKCHASGLDCEWKEIAKTRVRKQPHTRVAELERKLSSLTAAIGAMHNSTTSETSRHNEDSVEAAVPSPAFQDSDFSSTATTNVTRISAAGPDFRSPSSGLAFPHPSPDLLHLGEFSSEVKSQLLEDFRTQMLPQYPILIIPENVSFDHLNQIKPFTANAIITAACCMSQPGLFRSMHERNVTGLSQAVVVEGCKSMDLLQALLVTATWSHPPDDLSKLNIYQWSHLACTMAMELGLGGKTSLQAQSQNIDDFMRDSSELQMEKYRTMFGVYLTCSRLAVSFRRQKMISFSSSTNTIIELFLQKCNHLHDRRLVAWLRLQNIAEEIEIMKQNAEMRLDPLMEASSIRNDFVLLQDRLKAWENALDPVLWAESLKIDYGLCKGKLHELTICYGQNIQQLDLPALTTRSSEIGKESLKVMSPRYIRALLSFVEGCQSILDVFLNASPETIRLLPILTMFRAPYAFKALAMLRKRMENSDDAINLLLDEQSLAWDIYSGNVALAMETASADRTYAIPTMALRIRESMMKSKAREQNATRVATGVIEAASGDLVQHNTIPMAPKYDTAYDMVDNLSIPFYSLPYENETWASNFVDFDFYPF